MHQLPSIHSTCCPDGVKQSTCPTDNFVKKNYTPGIGSVSTTPIAPSIILQTLLQSPIRRGFYRRKPLFCIRLSPNPWRQPASDPGTQ